MHSQSIVFLSGEEIVLSVSNTMSLLLGQCYSNSFIILEPKIKMDNYSSVRNKWVFPYKEKPSEENTLIHVRKICIAQVHKLKLFRNTC